MKEKIKPEHPSQITLKQRRALNQLWDNISDLREKTFAKIERLRCEIGIEITKDEMDVVIEAYQEEYLPLLKADPVARGIRMQYLQNHYEDIIKYEVLLNNLEDEFHKVCKHFGVQSAYFLIEKENTHD
jgi:hypothetical protein